MEAEPPGRHGPRWPAGAIAVAVVLILGTLAVGVIGGGKPGSGSTRTLTTSPTTPAQPLGAQPPVTTIPNTAPPPTGDPVRPRSGGTETPCVPSAPTGRGHHARGAGARACPKSGLRK